MINLIIGLLLFASTPLDHDIHVSICEVEVSKDKMELTLKTFLDDLQIAVGLVPGQELPENYRGAEELIKEYIDQSIQISISEEPLTLNVEDIASSPEAIWITIVSDFPTDFSSLVISNTFLTEVYDDQTNLVNIKYGKKKDSFILNGKRKKVEFDPVD